MAALSGIPGVILLDDCESMLSTDIAMLDVMAIQMRGKELSFEITIDEAYWNGKDCQIFEDDFKPNKPFYRQIEHKRKKGGKNRF